MERGNVRLMCFAQEHNTFARFGFDPDFSTKESCAVTIRPLGIFVYEDPLRFEDWVLLIETRALTLKWLEFKGWSVMW